MAGPRRLRTGTSLVMLALASTACAPASTVSPSASAAASSLASPTVADPTPTATPGRLSISWSTGNFSGDVGAVIADRDRFVAVGAQAESRMAWTSADGGSWDEEVVPGLEISPDCSIPDDRGCIQGTAAMGQLVRLGDTLYSMGSTASFNDYIGTVGWRLIDGQAWTVIESSSAFYAFGRVEDLVASDDALVAVKGDRGLWLGPTIWRWTPDTSWDDAALPGVEAIGSRVTDAAWADGTFVAVGATPVGDPRPSGEIPTAPALWTSGDGLTWTRGRPPEDRATLCAISATTRGFMILGWSPSGPSTWTSRDASSWIRSDLPLPEEATRPGPLDAIPCAAIEVNGGFAAVVGVQQGTVVWTSRDGTTWDGGQLLDVLTTSDHVAALGSTVVIFGRQAPWEPVLDEYESRLIVGSVAE